MAKKTVLIACGPPRSILMFRGKLIQEIQKTHRVVLFSPQIKDDQIKQELEEMGVKIHENILSNNTISLHKDIGYCFHLFRILLIEKPEVFFSFTVKPIVYGSTVASFFGVKKIFSMLTGLGYNFIESGIPQGKTQRLVHGLLRFSLRWNNRVIFHNADDRDLLVQMKIVRNEKKTAVVNGSGIDLSAFRYNPPKIDSNITYLMIGRLLVAKGIREYYEAAKLLKKKFPSVNFLLIGEYEKSNIGSIDHELYDQIISDNIVEYRGYTKDVAELINTSSVVVLPSYREGTPRALLEAMAIGRPVITTDVPGCREVICPDDNKRNGFLVPVKNVISLADKMSYFILNPLDIATYGFNGRQYAEQKFDVNLINRQMLGFLELPVI